MSFPSFCGVSRSKPKLVARSAYASGRSSKTATIPGSPWRMPSAMNWVARTDFPVPEDPATSTLSPSRTPPSSILSNSGIPKQRRRLLGGFLLRAVNPNVREKACTPASVMRKVCNPGTESCPRSFTICSFRTMEFRSAVWRSQNSPSATVNIGLSRNSSSAYSPIRKVVATSR